MSKNWYPMIDYEKCIGCMACSKMCHHGVYKQDRPDGKPSVAYGDGCVHGCRGCQRRCPTGAICYFGDNDAFNVTHDVQPEKPYLTCEGKPKVAFVCVHNSCRSQIAEALGKRYAFDVFESYSAGTEIKPQINQDAVRIMKGLYGIDMEQTQYSKLITDIPDPDIAISMGCNVGCPFIGRAFDDNWGVEDPTGKSDNDFLRIIKDIENKILQLRDELKTS